ncbi:MAG: anhydro-N-acetylmuramic acid kinase [Alphaproteobacteria bacterium]|nr:anhydro-N-acetylmuramic acid kinase [Alphaproteobacteria bacterium]
MAELRWAIGLMSGTSCDGIDAALLRGDGERRIETGPWLTLPYDPGFRAQLRGVMGGSGDVAAAERALTERHAGAVRKLLSQAGLDAGNVALIGFHGQTILHDPAHRRTWQIGDGALLAELTGIDVVYDFRSADVAAGGQGAPLAPLFHLALSAALERPLAVLNIGGVANATWIGGAGEEHEAPLLAFDTGPGNGPIDDWALAHTGMPLDRDGALARAGRVDARALDRLLGCAYFALPPPKSLDRDQFDLSAVDGLSAADGAATLTAFTARSVKLAERHFPAQVRRWIVTGGGRHNPALMAALAAELSAPVVGAEAVGWDGDALEAQAFAHLALRAVRGLPISLPTTTGVPRPMTGGRIVRRPRT